MLNTGSSTMETGSSKQSWGERWAVHSHSRNVAAQNHISRNKLQVIMKEKVTTLTSCNAHRTSQRWIGGSWVKGGKKKRKLHMRQRQSRQKKEKRRCRDWVGIGKQPSGPGACIRVGRGQGRGRGGRGEIVIWCRLWTHTECRVKGFGF